jgi:ligand-binding sensor domain-containing protein/DNA-binding CsgD family transcriptional regulator
MCSRFLKLSALQLICLAIINNIDCQVNHSGIPFITNYGIEDYGAGTHNLEIAQDSRGVIYVANHYGLLSFNGSAWKHIAQPPNKTMIRSVAIDTDDQIFVGCQNEFGYIYRSSSGQISYISLLDRVPERMRDFNDIWKVILFDNNVIFHSIDALYIYDRSSGSLNTIASESGFQFIAKVFQGVYVVDEDRGLMQLVNGSFLKPLPRADMLRGLKVAFILPFYNNGLLIGTIDNGIFIYDGKQLELWKNPLHNFFIENKISNATLLENGLYAIGTVRNGVVIINAQGMPHQHMNRKKGLYSNKVNATYEDHHGNLWLAFDNGIDYVEISSPFSFYGLQNNLEGAVHDIHASREHLYTATTHGLFSLHRGANVDSFHLANNFIQFSLLSNPTYTIDRFDNGILIGNQHGTYTLENGRISKISDQEGGWKFIRWNDDSEYIIGGTYHGLVLYRREGNRWVFRHRIKGFNESSRIMVQDDSHIWVAHGYKGVFKIKPCEKLDSISSLQFYNSNNGFPSDLFISVFKINNEILFGTERGVYHYDRATDRMKLHREFSSLLDSTKHIRLLKKDPKGNIWFIYGYDGEDATGYLEPLWDGSFRKHYTPFQKLRGLHVAGFENISFYNEQVYFGIKKGLIHFDPSRIKRYDQPFHVVIDEVTSSKNDSLIYGTAGLNFLTGDETVNKEAGDHTGFKIPYKMNAFRFTFSSPFFENQDQIEYSTYLEGYDDEWSAWTGRTVKEYTNLADGRYIFRVKAVNGYGYESQIASFHFSITPPWYRSPAGFLIYILFAVLLLAGIGKIQSKRFEIATRKLRIQQIKELRMSQADKIKLMLENENKLILASKEKLESELALNTLNLAQLNEKLIYLREKLTDLQAKSQTELKQPIEAIISDINNTINDEEQWEQFKFYFNQTHQDFLQRLTEQYSDLTSVDIKVAALLRMNLSSKKIASLLNITVRGVEAARLRIRKKINLDSNESLTDFMVKY